VSISNHCIPQKRKCKEGASLKRPAGHAGQYGLARISKEGLDAGYNTDGTGGGRVVGH
jgi:hypothetical protein